MDNTTGCMLWANETDCTDQFTTGYCEASPSPTCAEADPCFSQTPSVVTVPPNLIMVLDKSGSMMAGAGGGDTRWGKLHQTVVSVVTAFQDRIAFGAKQFGSRNWAEGELPKNANQQCAVDAGLEAIPALNNLANIVAGILPEDAYISPYCLTPGESGYEAAVSWLAANRPADPNALILIMDGFISDGRDIGGGQAPDCGDTVQGLIADLENAWQDRGWPTYIVGVDIEQSVKDEMNQYAEAGGKPKTGTTKFYDTSAGSGLQAALEEIAGEVASCTVELGLASPNPELTQVTVDGVTYDQISANQCDSQAGWYYADAPNNLLITLCGAACEAFKLVDSAEVEYFCSAG